MLEINRGRNDYLVCIAPERLPGLPSRLQHTPAHITPLFQDSWATKRALLLTSSTVSEAEESPVMARSPGHQQSPRGTPQHTHTQTHTNHTTGRTASWAKTGVASASFTSATLVRPNFRSAYLLNHNFSVNRFLNVKYALTINLTKVSGRRTEKYLFIFDGSVSKNVTWVHFRH